MDARLLFVVAVGLLVGADAPDDAVKKEQQKLRGTWAPVSQEAGGVRRDKDKLNKHEWVFDGDKLTVREATKAREHTFTLDPGKTPKTIDLTDRRGDPAARGIYKLEGDTLTVALDKPTADRPAAFTTKKDSSYVVIVLKREKQ